ncbi:MAG: GGDEF domain-containing protein [Ruminococcus sp.]|nr:GGDEF domain-containing protein [Ruminococcus sp.]
MIFGYAFIVIAAVLTVTYLSLRKTDTVLKNEVTTLTSSLNVQMKLNLESYMSRMETIATLAFGDKLSYTYDATDPNNDEYEAINNEKVLSEKLYSLCIMENFVDYGIVYRNNRTVGKISNATSSLFGDRLFYELEKMISNPRYGDGWFTGFEDNFKRIYYVKQIHDNALLFISFYSYELGEVFDNPETLSDMKIRLVDKDYNIIYSKNSDERGLPLPEEIRKRIEGYSSASLLDDKYLVSVNRTGDWFVVCSIPTQIILNEKNEMTRFLFFTGIAAAVAAALVGFYLSYLLIKPVKSLVSDLDDKASSDRLTGILNKLAFEEMSSACIEHTLETEHRALIIFDIDDFKAVNDNYGHAAGDRLLRATGEILRSLFSEDDYLGRIGGDEFCVLVNSCLSDEKALRESVEAKCREFGKRLHSIAYFTEKSADITASIGISLFPENGRSFSELYNACDKALYRSKNDGKNSFSFFDPDTEREGEQ